MYYLIISPTFYEKGYVSIMILACILCSQTWGAWKVPAMMPAYTAGFPALAVFTVLKLNIINS